MDLTKTTKGVNTATMLMSGNLRKLNAVSLCYNNTLMESVYHLYNIVADSQWASTLLKCKASMVTDGQVTLHLFVHTDYNFVSNSIRCSYNMTHGNWIIVMH